MESRHAVLTRADGAQASQLPPITLDGWYVLHQLFRIEWPRLKSLDPEDVTRLRASLDGLGQRWGTLEAGWSGFYSMVGSGVDLMLLHFRDTLDGLSATRVEISSSAFGDLLVLDREYVSIVELGLYALTSDLAASVDPGDPELWARAVENRLSEERARTFVQRRLYPTQPDDMPYVCYYPMDKRRKPGVNWYTLGLDERARLMMAHGAVGRRYARRISQIISGSIGLADWEWAVTLFAGDPVDFKRVVTEMRYDEVSALYADFGQFFVGKKTTPGELGGLLAGAV